MTTLKNKTKLLKEKLAVYDSVAVAFSGGVDSAFLVAMAKEVLGERVLAVTVVGPNFPPDEMRFTKEFCKKRKIPHMIINLEEEILEALKNNGEDRCYHCKRAIFSALRASIEAQGILEGTNIDDQKDYRPGRKAIKELGITSPLEEAGFTKLDIRQGLKAMNIPMWDKPASACLVSRIPMGEEITKEKMAKIYKGEAYLKELGFKQVRVRWHNQLAKIEVPQADLVKLLEEETGKKVLKRMREIGFTYVAIDIEGYKMGNMNSPQTKKNKAKADPKSKAKADPKPKAKVRKR